VDQSKIPERCFEMKSRSGNQEVVLVGELAAAERVESENAST
jgi:hypothetical protein